MNTVKFIIQQGHLRIGRVDRHHNLTLDGKEVEGGGYVHVVKDGADLKELTFFGKSVDFGSVDKNDLVQSCRDLHENDRLRSAKWFYSKSNELSEVLSNRSLIFQP